MIDEVFWLGFQKEASSMSDPLPEDFLEKVLQMPKPQRDKAVQERMQEFGAQMRQSIHNNITEALTNLREKSLEDKIEGVVGEK